MPGIIEDTSQRELQVADLAERAMAGNSYCFEKLMGLFQKDIFRMVYYRTASRMDAEDLTQDIFTQAYRSLYRLKEAVRFKSWLFTIALNRVRDFYRKRRPLVFFGSQAEFAEFHENRKDAPEDMHGEDRLVRKDFWEHVRKLLTNLSDREREVFMLRFLDQLNIREISGVINKSESSVKTYLYRALRKIRDNPEFSHFIEGESL